MTVNLEDLTPEEMCAGLMRGNASTLKLGYDYRAATLTVSSYKDLVEKDVLEDLHSFARGFSDGMAVSLERANPGKHYERVGESNVDRVGPYSIGYAMGSGEDGFRLHPAIREVEGVAN